LLLKYEQIVHSSILSKRLTEAASFFYTCGSSGPQELAHRPA